MITSHKGGCFYLHLHCFVIAQHNHHGLYVTPWLLSVSNLVLSKRIPTMQRPMEWLLVKVSVRDESEMHKMITFL